jgi:hypothetical protein
MNAIHLLSFSFKFSQKSDHVCAGHLFQREALIHSSITPLSERPRLHMFEIIRKRKTNTLNDIAILIINRRFSTNPKVAAQEMVCRRIHDVTNLLFATRSIEKVGK